MAEDYLKKEILGKIKSDEKILKWQLWRKTAKEAKIAKDRNIIRPFPSDVLKREDKLVETAEEKNLLVFM